MSDVKVGSVTLRDKGLPVHNIERRRAKRTRERLEEDAYEDEDGVLRWEGSDNLVPPHVLERDAYLSVPVAQREADRERMKEIREQERNKEYSDVQKAEMRNAFGEDADVVNVLTGESVSL